MNDLRIAFWGTSRFSVITLDKMANAGLLPALIITSAPRKKGRGMEMTPSEVKVWADAHHVPTLEPEKLDSGFIRQLSNVNCQLFIIASYGKIVPQNILELPKHGTLNVHPSLLPKLRGASPLQSGILSDVEPGTAHETGVTIMLIDEQVDHGDIVAQEKISIPNWPPKGAKLEEMLGALGGKLLVKTIPLWIDGKIIPQEQDHDHATFTKKMTSGSGQIYLDDDPVRMYRKIQAFDSWPRAYFTTSRNGRDIRVVVTEAHLADGKLVLDRVIPEGKKEMSYEDFMRGQRDSG
ncbi:MAG: methionyl-tRNA formyltransferase [Candidatus Yonathbacteria bacterium]|nr:methionyl-tRNA formyltransferase [Candidatus Yonathbacteria bacterium]